MTATPYLLFAGVDQAPDSPGLEMTRTMWAQVSVQHRCVCEERLSHYTQVSTSKSDPFFQVVNRLNYWIDRRLYVDPPPSL